jgi:hypothetical protein
VDTLLGDLIHPSAWKRSSANFACKEFCELRLYSALGSSKQPMHLAARLQQPSKSKISHLGDALPRIPGVCCTRYAASRRRVKAQDRYLPSS